MTKLDWIKFFRQWKDSDMPMEAYVVKLAQEAPLTLGAQVVGTGSETGARVANACAQQLTVAAAKAESLGYTTAAASASKAAERAAGVGDQLAKKATSLFNKK